MPRPQATLQLTLHCSYTPPPGHPPAPLCSQYGVAWQSGPSNYHSLVCTNWSINFICSYSLHTSAVHRHSCETLSSPRWPGHERNRTRTHAEDHCRFLPQTHRGVNGRPGTDNGISSPSHAPLPASPSHTLTHLYLLLPHTPSHTFTCFSLTTLTHPYLLLPHTPHTPLPVSPSHTSSYPHPHVLIFLPSYPYPHTLTCLSLTQPNTHVLTCLSLTHPLHPHMLTCLPSHTHLPLLQM